MVKIDIDEFVQALESGELKLAKQPPAHQAREMLGLTPVNCEIIGRTVWILDQATGQWSVVVAVEGGNYE